MLCPGAAGGGVLAASFKLQAASAFLISNVFSCCGPPHGVLMFFFVSKQKRTK
jgi:hypothetical protein